MRSSSRVYSFNAYDNNLNLKVPPGVQLAVLFATKHIWMIFLAYTPFLPGNTSYLKGHISAVAAIPDLLGAVMLAAWGLRHHTTALAWRMVWRNGRWLLMSAYLAHLAYNGYLLTSPNAGRAGSSELTVAMTVIDALLLWYLATKPIVRDLFSDEEAAASTSEARK